MSSWVDPNDRFLLAISRACKTSALLAWSSQLNIKLVFERWTSLDFLTWNFIWLLSPDSGLGHFACDFMWDDDDPHYIGSYQHKSNQFQPFSPSQKPRTEAFSRIWSRCNVIDLVPIWEFPGVNSQFQGTNHRCMRLRLPFIYRFVALTPWFFPLS